jgi:hypothetical protein
MVLEHAGSHIGRSHTNRVPRDVGIGLGESSCRHTNDFLGHTMVWSVHRGDLRNG